MAKEIIDKLIWELCSLRWREEKNSLESIIDNDVFYNAFVETYKVVGGNKEYFTAKWDGQTKVVEDILAKVTSKRFIGIFKK